jgi:nucleotide-binding universal stress UspA family protein
MFKRLIVATDLSAASYALAKCLGGMRNYGAEECLLLQCLSVQETASLSLHYTIAVLEQILQNQKKILEHLGYKVETRIVPGLAKNEINRIAAEEDYSLIVVGAQKHSLVREALFGGLAYDIIHQLQKPILIIRMEDNPKDGVSCIENIGCDFKDHVLHPTDFSENAGLALNYVEKFAIDGVRKITLLHVQDISIYSEYPKEKLEEHNAIDNARLLNIKKRLQDKADVEVDILLNSGSPSVEIMKLIRERQVQLVVMGTQGSGFVKELFLGSVSHNIARHSEASVLLIPAKR